MQKASILTLMEQPIIHTCGHEQVHYITGFASQQDRKAAWLRTTLCRTCFAAARKAEQVEAVMRDGTAIAHLSLPLLVGSERQVAWATTIRAGRLAAMLRDPTSAGRVPACMPISDAKWWIDHRDLTADALLERAALQTTGQADGARVDMSQAA
jgi:hypothetical protein